MTAPSKKKIKECTILLLSIFISFMKENQQDTMHF